MFVAFLFVSFVACLTNESGMLRQQAALFLFSHVSRYRHVCVVYGKPNGFPAESMVSRDNSRFSWKTNGFPGRWMGFPGESIVLLEDQWFSWKSPWFFQTSAGEIHGAFRKSWFVSKTDPGKIKNIKIKTLLSLLDGGFTQKCKPQRRNY